MKRLCLVLLLIIYPLITQESTIDIAELEFIKEQKADFRVTLAHIIEYESYYANVPADKGGETYGGISRRFNPNWYGWRHIDAYKRKYGPIPRYQRLPELDHWVLDYYLDIWVKEGFYEFKDQTIANYVFDLRINSQRKGVQLLCNSLRKFGKDYDVNRLSNEVVLAINDVPAEAFLADLRRSRVSYYYGLVRRNSSQQQFIKHWLKRANYINNEKTIS